MSDTASIVRQLRPERPTWTLTAVAVRDVTPRMRRVSLIGDELARFSYRPGQDMSFSVPDGYGGLARRHYTIRRFDRQELRLDIDIVLHGEGPGARWARQVRLGDVVAAQGPRGRIGVSGRADWRLFSGDETALPGIAAMIEALPAGERVFAVIEVDGPEEEQPIHTAADLDLVWLHRRGPPVASSRGLIEALTRFDLPAGAGQAVVIGETAAVRAQRQGLIARGLPKTQIAAEGYWRPGRIGGHDHIVEPDFLTALAGAHREHRRRRRRYG
ncbi:MAG TPA: siderophore-interacting protein [Caulobacteraceae bacterium]|nr:siderophore-interacting protein [Caulobacteraceae bacterium]